MTPIRERDPVSARVDTLTSTTDQLQAEIDAIARQIALLVLGFLALSTLIGVIAWRTSGR